MSVPVSVKLNRSFDVEKLRCDLDAAKLAFKAKPQIGHYHDGNWKGISLVSLDGDANTLFGRPQGAGIYTEVLDHCPYFKDIFDNLGFRVTTARLLFLAPGKTIGKHFDFDLWEQGIIRIHIPIITNPKVHFTIDDQRMDWKPGEFWFGDFRKMHSIHNASDETRVHLVMDAMVNQKLLDLFPSDAIEAIKQEVTIGIHEDEVKPSQTILNDLTGYFIIPKGLMKPYLPLICEFKTFDRYLDFVIPGFLFKQRFVPTQTNRFTGMVFAFDFRPRSKMADNKAESKAYLRFSNPKLDLTKIKDSPNKVLLSSRTESDHKYILELRRKLPLSLWLPYALQKIFLSVVSLGLMAFVKFGQLTKKVTGVKH